VQISYWSGSTCAPVAKTVKTSVPAWTLLGTPAFGANPAGTRFPSPASDSPDLLPDQYCVRVSARADRVGADEVFGDPTYLKNGNTTYPADTILYWRVRASDENGIGLTWSATFPRQAAATPWGPGRRRCRTHARSASPAGSTRILPPTTSCSPGTRSSGVKQYKLQVSGRPDFATTIENVSTDNAAYAPKLSDVAYMSGTSSTGASRESTPTTTSETFHRLNISACCRA
jgi:hypothetical protein